MSDWNIILYLVPNILAAVICLALGIYLAIWRPVHWGASLSGLMGTAGLYSLMYAFQLVNDHLEAKVFLNNLEYILIVSIPVMYFLFALRLNGQERITARGGIALLFSIPFVTLVMVWTNPLHNLMFSNQRVVAVGPVFVLAREFGQWFWFSNVYLYILILIAVGMLIFAAVRSPHIFKLQKVLVAFSALLPLVLNALFLLNSSPVPGINFTPAAFALSGILLVVALFPLRMIHLIPFARELVLDQMTDLVIILNQHDQLLDMNPPAQRLTQKPLNEIAGKDLTQVFPRSAELVEQYRSFQHLREEVFIPVDGVMTWFELSIDPLRIWADGSSGRLVVLRNINQRKKTELELVALKQQLEERVLERTWELTESQARLYHSQARLEAIVNNLAAGIAVVSPDGKYIQVNDTWADMLGYSKDELFKMRTVDVVAESGDALTQEWLLARTSGRYEPYRFEKRFRCKDGKEFWAEVSVTPILSASGGLEGMLCVVFDISDRKLYEHQLIHNAFHDALTKLPNRVLFTERLNRAIQRAKLHLDHRFAVLYLDFDNFKTVNDSLGHNAGDKLLISIGERLCGQVSPADTVARLGGDEFVILLEENPQQEVVIALANRILAGFKQPFDLEAGQVVIGASIGVVFGGSDYASADDILRDADIAMYRAKVRGRNRWEVFDASLRDHAMQRMMLEVGLRQALEHGDLRLYYQPIMRAHTGALVGFEALVRWLHPTRGIVAPLEFIPVAEESGLILAMGQWILREAASQLKLWKDRFPELADLYMSVNVSARQFNQLEFYQQVADILAETGINPASLLLEITESALLDDFDQALDTMHRLRGLGVEVVIDDFGTGYSSLNYLHRLPIDTLKIDREFISSLTNEKEADKAQSAQEIIRAVLAMARELEIKVVAEGVETELQRDILDELACDYVQGYLFARPLDSASAEDYITQSISVRSQS